MEVETLDDEEKLTSYYVTFILNNDTALKAYLVTMTFISYVKLRKKILKTKLVR